MRTAKIGCPTPTAGVLARSYHDAAPAWYIAVRYTKGMTTEITTDEYRALAELRYRIRHFLREGDAVAGRRRGDHPDLGRAVGIETSQRGGIDRPPGDTRLRAARARARRPAPRIGFAAAPR